MIRLVCAFFTWFRRRFLYRLPMVSPVWWEEPLGFDEVGRVVTENGFHDAYWVAPPSEACLWRLALSIEQAWLDLLLFLARRGILYGDDGGYFRDLRWWFDR